jgi:hypothetical protein
MPFSGPMSGRLEDWLAGLGLSRYAEVFAAQAIDLDVLPDLSESDLERLGIPLVRRGDAHHRLHRRSRIDDLRVIEKILTHLDAKAAAAQAARPLPCRAAPGGPFG